MILFKKEALKKAHTSDMFETIAGKKRKEQEVQISKREYKMWFNNLNIIIWKWLLESDSRNIRKRNKNFLHLVFILLLKNA